MVDYSDDMRMVYYTETNDIEIIDGNRYAIYFENLDDFIELIGTDERLLKALKEKLREAED